MKHAKKKNLKKKIERVYRISKDELQYWDYWEIADKIRDRKLNGRWGNIKRRIFWGFLPPR